MGPRDRRTAHMRCRRRADQACMAGPHGPNHERCDSIGVSQPRCNSTHPAATTESPVRPLERGEHPPQQLPAPQTRGRPEKRLPTTYPWDSTSRTAASQPTRSAPGGGDAGPSVRNRGGCATGRTSSRGHRGDAENAARNTTLRPAAETAGPLGALDEADRQPDGHAPPGPTSPTNRSKSSAANEQGVPYRPTTRPRRRTEPTCRPEPRQCCRAEG